MSAPATGAFQTLVSSLKMIPGVTGTVVVAPDGVVVAHEMSGDPEKEGSVAVYVGHAATQISQCLSASPMKWAVVGIGQETVLIFEQQGCYIGLYLDERSSPSTVAGRALSVLAQS